MRCLKLLPICVCDMKRQGLALCNITNREGSIWRQEAFICKNHPETILQLKFNCFTIIQNTPSKNKPKEIRTFADLLKMLAPNTCRESFRSSHYPCSPDRVCVSASLSASMIQQRNFYTAITKLNNNHQIIFCHRLS